MPVTTERFTAPHSLVRIVGKRGRCIASFHTTLADLAMAAARAASELAELSSEKNTMAHRSKEMTDWMNSAARRIQPAAGDQFRLELFA